MVGAILFPPTEIDLGNSQSRTGSDRTTYCLLLSALPFFMYCAAAAYGLYQRAKLLETLQSTQPPGPVEAEDIGENQGWDERPEAPKE